jgi:hypothetical protein
MGGGGGEKHYGDYGDQKPFGHYVIRWSKIMIAVWGWWLKTFRLAHVGGDWIFFGCHSCMAIEFDRHSMALTKFDHYRIIIMYFDCYRWICSIFGCHLGTAWWRLILEEVFGGYMSLKMQSMIHFLTFLFSFGFCVFGCLFITIVWNLGWVEVIKSLVKGYIFCIFCKF